MVFVSENRPRGLLSDRYGPIFDHKNHENEKNKQKPTGSLLTHLNFDKCKPISPNEHAINTASPNTLDPDQEKRAGPLGKGPDLLTPLRVENL